MIKFGHFCVEIDEDSGCRKGCKVAHDTRIGRCAIKSQREGFRCY